jgi:hypothetical protein
MMATGKIIKGIGKKLTKPKLTLRIPTLRRSRRLILCQHYPDPFELNRTVITTYAADGMASANVRGAEAFSRSTPELKKSIKKLTRNYK